MWHDGAPVTSDDILFTVELLRTPSLYIPLDVRNLWKSVEVKALNEKTLQFRLPEPFSPFLDYLAFGVLPSHLLGGVTLDELSELPFNLQPVGSGPYRFERLLVEAGQVSGVVLRPFENYYQAPPFIEQFEFRYYPDAVSALEAYRQGTVQGINQITPEILPQVLTEANLSLYTSRLPELSLVLFNLGSADAPFFQDAQVRRALLTGLNRQWIIDRLLGGQAIQASGPIFPGTWAAYDGIQPLSFDSQAALNELKAAGYVIPAEGGSVRARDGAALSFELLHLDTPEQQAIAAAIQRDWAALGVEARLKAVSYEAMLGDHLEPRNYQAALVALTFARSPDPDPYPFWHQAQAAEGQNYTAWDDRQASEYLEQARVTADPAERARLYRNFQVRFANELPALPLFYPVYTYAVDRRVQGVRVGPLFDPSDRFLNVSSWFLVVERGVQPITPTPAP
jgi:peptide/nickel transport system substrate-binding protein